MHNESVVSTSDAEKFSRVLAIYVCLTVLFIIAVVSYIITKTLSRRCQPPSSDFGPSISSTPSSLKVIPYLTPYNSANDLTSSNQCSLYTNVYSTQNDSPPPKLPNYDDTITPNFPQINARFIIPDTDDGKKKPEFYDSVTNTQNNEAGTSVANEDPKLEKMDEQLISSSRLYCRRISHSG